MHQSLITSIILCGMACAPRQLRAAIILYHIGSPYRFFAVCCHTWNLCIYLLNDLISFQRPTKMQWKVHSQGISFSLELAHFIARLIRSDQFSPNLFDVNKRIPFTWCAWHSREWTRFILHINCKWNHFSLHWTWISFTYIQIWTYISCEGGTVKWYLPFIVSKLRLIFFWALYCFVVRSEAIPIEPKNNSVCCICLKMK